MNHILFFMGVSGAGKSSVAKAVATERSMVFIEGDDYHPLSNVQKMAAGIPLTDEDRWPWLEKLAKAVANEAQTQSVAVSCSLLKRRYRDYICTALPQARIIYLYAPKTLIAARMNDRKGHFFKAAMLDSQFDTLEEPNADENVIFADVSGSLVQTTRAVLAELGNGHAEQQTYGHKP